MAKKDAYEVLEVSRDGSDQEIKQAYYRLEKEHHPDKNPGDASSEEKFKELAEPYAVLSDSEKRASYDQFGHGGMDGGFTDFRDFAGFVPLMRFHWNSSAPFRPHR